MSPLRAAGFSLGVFAVLGAFARTLKIIRVEKAFRAKTPKNRKDAKIRNGAGCSRAVYSATKITDSLN